MWQLCRPGMTACPVASMTSTPSEAARGSASTASTGPTATIVSPSISTEPGSRTAVRPVMGRTMPLRIRVRATPPNGRVAAVTVDAPEPAPGTVDLLVTGADLVVTMDDDRRELPGGWVACQGGFVVAVGSGSDPSPDASRRLRADGCLITPGLVNTHHHIYQNLTRAHLPATNSSLFDWLPALYPRWAR